MVVQEVCRALAGDLNHYRSVSRPPRSFFSFSFAFVYCTMSRLMKLFPFLGVMCCCIRWGISFPKFFSHF